MGISLYELTDEYKAVEAMLEEEGVEEQVILDSLEGIGGEIEEKADNYAKMIKNLLAEAEALKAEEERLSARRKARESLAQKLKSRLQANLEFIGKTKFKTLLFSFSVARNGGKQPLFITENIEEIPGKYLIQQPPIPDKEAIRELLKEKEVDWAHFTGYGTHLNIR